MQGEESLREEKTMSDRRKRVQIYPALFILFFGFAALLNFTGSPAFTTIRTVDVVRLVGSGMCFGAAIVLLGLFFRGPRPD